MKLLLVLSLAVLAAGFVSGCGDPAPSTALAPEQKMPDVTKMSPEQIEAMHKKDNAGDHK